MLHYTSNVTPEIAVNDDGTIAALVEEILLANGGEIDDWEGNGLWVIANQGDTDKVIATIEAMKTGVYGADIKEYMGWYYLC